MHALDLTILILGIIGFRRVESALNYADYDENGPHACQRACVAGEAPMICEYTFNVEWYLTLPKACWDCPFNITQCDSPHCVVGDGLRRPIIATNRRMPGPLVEVCENDTIRATVHNGLLDGQGLTVHWHGMHQPGTPYMDGAGMVTQCLIPFDANFTYEFTAIPAGTHFYHSHTGFQRGDGQFGGLVVHPLPAEDPNYDLYDHDCDVINGHCEYVMHVNDMTPSITSTSFLHHMFHMNHGVEYSSLIEGRNQKYPVEKDNNPSITALTPYTVFTVQQDKSYRFRVIHAGNSECAYKISIDGHTLTMIAADGMSVKPVTMDTFSIFPGEIYDFVVTADQAIDNYWVKSHGLIECLYHDAYAVLQYQGAPAGEPAGIPGIDRRGYFQNAILSDLGHSKYQHGEPYDLWTDGLRSAIDEDYSTEIADVTHYVAMDFYANDYSRFNNPDYYPPDELPTSRRNYLPVLDNITFHIPSIPALSQPEDLDPSALCNRSSIDHAACYEFGCSCVHVEQLELNQVVEVILVNEGVAFSGGGHPMHLHGYKFRIIGIGKVGSSTSVAEIQSLDGQGLLDRNYQSPSYRDTVVVPDGGYVILRFFTDNPGYWFLHCHIETHVEQGQGLVFKVGTGSDFPPVPENFPRCGSWSGS